MYAWLQKGADQAHLCDEHLGLPHTKSSHSTSSTPAPPDELLLNNPRAAWNS